MSLEFSFSLTSCFTKAEERSLPYYLRNELSGRQCACSKNKLVFNMSQTLVLGFTTKISLPLIPSVSTLWYHQIFLVFCHIMRMAGENGSTPCYPSLHSRLGSKRVQQRSIHLILEDFDELILWRREDIVIRGAYDKLPDIFCTGIENCRRLLKIQYVIAIHLMRWPTNYYDFSFKWTATAAIWIHPTKAWLSQLMNFKNAIWHFRRTICNKIVF